MKLRKLFLIVCSLCLGLTLTLGLAACGEDDKPTGIPVISIALDKASLNLETGDTYALKATVLPSNADDKTVSWHSSKNSVATVDNTGKVTAVSAGIAEITATASGKSASCAVTVTEKSVTVIPVANITVNKPVLNLEVGDTQEIVATVLPANATNRTVTWASSSSCVTVENGKVKAVSVGSADVTATADGKTAVCKVTVTEKTEIIPVTKVSINEIATELTVGESYTVIATVEPENATDKTLSWSSSNEAVATVSDGKVTALSVGDTTITVTAGGKSATCKITVKAKIIEVTDVTLNKTSAVLSIGATEVLTATARPENATEKAVSWKSSNESVAEVTNGVVLAKSKGTATITATIGGKSATCKVTVTGDVFVDVTEITLNKNDLELELDATFLLIATVLPENATNNEVIWSSSDEGVASVEDGLVTAKSVGTAVITAKIGKISAVCEIAVIEGEEEPPINPESIITYAHSGEECAAFEWNEINASGAKVEYKLSSASKYTQIDKQLIRQISPTTARADILGLKGGAEYDFKITSSENKVSYATQVAISSHDRSGYAHHNYTNGVGAYNDDGTLKSNAVVIYVTEANKNNVDGNGNSIAEYLAAAQKNKNPIVIRIIGTVGAATWKEGNVTYTKTPDNTDGDGNLLPEAIKGANGKALSKNDWSQADLIAGGYNVLDTSVYKELKGLSSTIKWDSSKNEFDSCWNDCQVKYVSNLTVEGVGEDAEIFQWGLTFKNCDSVEVRNLRFYDYTEDACSFEASENSTTLDGFKHGNYWIHNNTFDIGVNYWDVCKEQDKHDGDGSTDFKHIKNVTVAYNRYNGTHKTGLVGGSDSAHQASFTFHHNYYNGCDQRMPLGRQANMHMYNNYYSGSGLYSISLRAGAYAFIENCVFTSGKGSTKPIEIQKGNNGMPSCKVIDCDMEGKITNPYGDAANNVYMGSDREYIVEGDNLYAMNFEQASDFYTVTNKLATNEVAKVIPQVAGVMKRASNIHIEGGSEEQPPIEVDPPEEPSDGQSVSYTESDAGTEISVDGIISDGDLFTASWNLTKASVKAGFSTATADDDSGRSFAYALLSNGTGGGVTLTAKKSITLTIYYGASDSKFATADQAKSGNLVWQIDGGAEIISEKTENKDNAVAYSEVITLEEGQTVEFKISANRFVLYGLFAE